MTKVNLTLFVNENKKTNPLAPPYSNSKFQPKHDIVLKADTVYEMSLFKNTHDYEKNPYTDKEGNPTHRLSITIRESEYWANQNETVEKNLHHISEDQPKAKVDLDDDIPF
jgi:hypothetical protein